MPGPLFSILIPARDEERFLPSCLASIEAALAFFKSADPATSKSAEEIIEVIVVLNRCTDRTESIAREAGCMMVRNDSKNLAEIRNAGAKIARGDILITIDADSRMSKNMLLEIYRSLGTASVVGGGVLTYPERWSLGIFATFLVLLPIIVWHRISAGLFFCSRVDFDALGGFDESLASVEDLDFAKRLRDFGAATGRKIATLFSAHIITSCRKFDRFGDWYFITHPHHFMTLLRGRNQAIANKVWYDFPR